MATNGYRRLMDEVLAGQTRIEDTLKQQNEKQSKQDQTVALIEQRVGDMHDRLFGNGQPGILEKMFNAMKQDAKDHAKYCEEDRKALHAKVESIDGKMKWAAGIAVGISLIIGKSYGWITTLFK